MSHSRCSLGLTGRSAAMLVPATCRHCRHTCIGRQRDHAVSFDAADGRMIPSYTVKHVLALYSLAKHPTKPHQAEVSQSRHAEVFKDVIPHAIGEPLPVTARFSIVCRWFLVCRRFGGRGR